MMDDRKYSFVVNRSTRNLIKIRRYDVSKRLIHVCAGAVIFSVGVVSYGVHGIVSNKSNTVYAQKQSSKTKGFFSTQVNEGGPEITETPKPRNEFEEKIRSLEQSFRDKENTPSIYPLVGKINNEFGWRRNPFGGYSTEHHPGMDIDGEKGNSVVAPAQGIVVKASYQGGYGNMIEVDHGNGLTTRYGHLSEMLVEPGQEIARGQEIGKVGSTGRSTGPHLHYEIRIDGEAVDPRSYLPLDANSAVQQ